MALLRSLHLATCKFYLLNKKKKESVGGLRTYLMEDSRMLVVYGQEDGYYLQQCLEELNSLFSQVEGSKYR